MYTKKHCIRWETWQKRYCKKTKLKICNLVFDYFCNTVSYHNPLFTFFIHKCFHINVFFNFIHICKTSHILPENRSSDIASTSLPLSLSFSLSLETQPYSSCMCTIPSFQPEGLPIINQKDVSRLEFVGF